jgi:hypothetical protein
MGKSSGGEQSKASGGLSDRGGPSTPQGSEGAAARGSRRGGGSEEERRRRACRGEVTCEHGDEEVVGASKQVGGCASDPAELFSGNEESMEGNTCGSATPVCAMDPPPEWSAVGDDGDFRAREVNERGPAEEAEDVVAVVGAKGEDAEEEEAEKNEDDGEAEEEGEWETEENEVEWETEENEVEGETGDLLSRRGWENSWVRSMGEEADSRGEQRGTALSSGGLAGELQSVKDGERRWVRRRKRR